MTLEILTFGIARDIVGSTILKLDITEGVTVADLKKEILSKYPRFESLTSLMIAVNTEYGNDATIVKAHDEIALIPPVSGG
ncbi:MAG: MoaD/ThiS family protein [Saprospiraceae bacterium]|nr:MoaD/ThiS family protein [Saprospiraceae bacterium]